MDLIQGIKQKDIESNLKYLHTPLPDPLTHLRLLQLLPGSPESPISCTLRTYPIEKCPMYQAVSYCWGDPAASASIYIDDKELSVTGNCWYALRQIQRVIGDGMLWLDSICIDQTNSGEKAAQVQRMASIFQNADHVLACLGPDAHDSQFLLQRLRQVPQLPSSEPWTSKAAVSKPLTDEKIHHTVGWLVSLDQDFGRFAAALKAFSKRAFFTRLWIYQEMFLASRVSLLCGVETANMHALTDIVDVCSSLIVHCRPHEEPVVLEAKFRLIALLKEHEIDLFASDKRLGTLPKMVRQLHREGQSSELRDFLQGPLAMQDVLVSVTPLRCRDSRDKIYGVISVFGSTCSIVPDYTLSNFELAREVLQHYTSPWDRGSGDYFQLTDLLCDNLELHKAGSAPAECEREVHVAMKTPHPLSMNTDVDRRMLVQRTPAGCRIALSESGQLTAPFKTNSPMLDVDVATHKRINVHGQTVAIVSIDALPGDWIIPISHYVSDYYREYRLGFVLRQRSENIYFVVGEVAFVTWNKPCDSYQTCQCQFGPDSHADYHTFFDLQLDPVELLLSTLRLQETFDLLRRDAPTDMIQSPKLPAGRTPLCNLTYAVRHDSTVQLSNSSTAIERRGKRNLETTRR